MKSIHEYEGKRVRVNGFTGEVLDAEGNEVRVLFDGYEDEGCTGFDPSKTQVEIIEA
jgi:hypothetical protein